MSSSGRRSSCDIREDGHSALLHQPRYVFLVAGLFFSLRYAVFEHRSALVGTVEELAASQQTLNLVRDQFEVNYFGPLNIIKASLLHMRRQKSGHVMIVSGISKNTSPRNYMNKMDILTTNSRSYRHPGPWDVLRCGLGSRGILRCTHHSQIICVSYLYYY